MTRTWWENEEIVRRLRDYLGRTAEEIESLTSASPEAAELSGTDQDVASLSEMSAAAWGTPPAGEVGLLQLVEAFTAMRHELKLQTKGTRNLEESANKTLAELDAAIRAFRSVQAQEQQAALRAAQPLVETLIGLDEGLRRAAQVLHATHRRMTCTAPENLRGELNAQFQRQPWWRRLINRHVHARTLDATTRLLEESIRDEFRGLMEGIELIQARLERTLVDHEIRRLDEPGGRADPRQMTVIELVTDVDAPPETVIEVLRPGYVWGERVVRFAEVRAVASGGSGRIRPGHANALESSCQETPSQPGIRLGPMENEALRHDSSDPMAAQDSE